MSQNPKPRYLTNIEIHYITESLPISVIKEYSKLLKDVELTPVAIEDLKFRLKNEYYPMHPRLDTTLQMKLNTFHYRKQDE